MQCFIHHAIRLFSFGDRRNSEKERWCIYFTTNQILDYGYTTREVIISGFFLLHPLAVNKSTPDRRLHFIPNDLKSCKLFWKKNHRLSDVCSRFAIILPCPGCNSRALGLTSQNGFSNWNEYCRDPISFSGSFFPFIGAGGRKTLGTSLVVTLRRYVRIKRSDGLVWTVGLTPEIKLRF